MICFRCGHNIRFNERIEDGNLYHSACHRDMITERYDSLVATLRSLWRVYRQVNATAKPYVHADYRTILARYHELSY